MLLGFGQLDFFLQLPHFPIYPHTNITALFQLLKSFLKLSLFAPGNGRQYLNLGALRISHNLIHHLLYRLLADWLAAFWTMGCPHPGKQQTQIIINLCHSPHCGTGIAAGGLLVNGYRRRQSFNIVHIRLIHLPQKLTGIRRQRFHIAALPFGINGVKSQRRFPGAAEPGHDNKFISWQFNINIFQVMHTSTLNSDGVFWCIACHHQSCSSRSFAIWSRSCAARSNSSCFAAVFISFSSMRICFSRSLALKTGRSTV